MAGSKGYFFVILVVTLFYILWVEYSVGNILLRTNSQGGRSLNFQSLWNLMTHPLHDKALWNKQCIDLNYPFVLSMTTFVYKMFG